MSKSHIHTFADGNALLHAHRGTIEHTHTDASGNPSAHAQPVVLLAGDSSAYINPDLIEDPDPEC